MLRKFLWLDNFRVVFWNFRRLSLSFLPQNIPPRGRKHPRREVLLYKRSKMSVKEVLSLNELQNKLHMIYILYLKNREERLKRKEEMVEKRGENITARQVKVEDARIL